jgi:hypothetical protein
MGIALEWGPWNTPLEPDDDDTSLELYLQKLKEALQAGRESDEKLAGQLPKSNP